MLKGQQGNTRLDRVAQFDDRDHRNGHAGGGHYVVRRIHETRWLSGKPPDRGDSAPDHDNPSRRLAVAGKAELTEMTNFFSAMVANLEERVAESCSACADLEITVAQWTHELDAANKALRQGVQLRQRFLGEISIERPPGQGTTVKLDLPAVPKIRPAT